ncbi:MAG: protein kinase [Gemmatimonadaceae bacterium]
MPDSPDASDQDAELRAHVQRALAATYEVDQEIGRGGMGIVYRAKDKRLKRFVAIKLLPPELSFRRDVRSRFLREAETAAQLSHPNIVPIYSVDEVENLVFFVMACVDGDNLATRLKKRGPLPVDQVRRVLTEVGEALAYAHARGVIHRDIKPDNILMDGVDGRALVTDFGIARAASGDGDSARLTATGIAIGTPAYMSPEQASGERDVDGRSDLYSLGIVAYQMLIGEPPFIGNTTPVLLVKHLAETPIPVEERRADIPPDLARIVMRLLQKSPDHRFPDATDLVQALKSGVVPATPLGTPVVAGGTARNAWSPPTIADAANQQTRRRSLLGVNVGGGTSNVGVGPRTPDDVANYVATADELARYNAADVIKFRKSLRFFLVANGALAAVSIFSSDKDFLGVTAIWTIIMAFKYTKLWTHDHDWRDVLHQPRNRMFGEVVSHLQDSFLATFSRDHREKLRAQGRLGNKLGITLSHTTPMKGLPAPAGSSNRPTYSAQPANDSALGAYASIVNRARSDRDEIVRLLSYLPEPERARIPEVANTANTLVGKIETIAISMANTEGNNGARSLSEIEAEIQQLESEANPFDTARSETRVRRLAQLRRERRMVIETSRSRDANRARLESCRLALENVRLDLVRLRTGNSSVQSVTLVAEQAMALAREIDIAVSAANEVRDLTRVRSS